MRLLLPVEFRRRSRVSGEALPELKRDPSREQGGETGARVSAQSHPLTSISGDLLKAKRFGLGDEDRSLARKLNSK